MKALDILVVGELNVDLILSQVQEFPRLGAEVLARDMVLTMGSSSAIFACNAATLGRRVGFVGKLGQDSFGDLVLESLRSKNVVTECVLRSRDYKTGITAALSFGNERAMVTYPGAMELLSASDVTDENLRQARHLHVSSIFLQPLLQRDLVALFRRAKALGLTTSLDTQWDPSERWNLDLPTLLPLVDVFIPNEDEVMALTQASSVETAVEKLRPHARWVAVKMGHKGAMLWADGRRYRAEPYLNPHVVDAIGAGDSFDAGFVSQFVQGAEPERCLRMGNLAGAINTTAAGGTGAFLSLERVRELARQQFHVTEMEWL